MIHECEYEMISDRPFMGTEPKVIFSLTDLIQALGMVYLPDGKTVDGQTVYGFLVAFLGKCRWRPRTRPE